jgi:two-component system nitrogen regulation response regulator NtrX
VIPLSVPPLRERGLDVTRLAEHFIAEFASEYGRRVKRLAPEAAQALRSYRWPGNVRELRNVIERLMIMVPSDTIVVEDLWFLDDVFVVSAAPTPSKVAPATPVTVRPLYEARDAWEREYLLQALAAFDGNMSRTADALGVERSNLYRKMRGLGIQTRKDDEPA